MSEFSMNTNSNTSVCFLVSVNNPELKFILLDKEPLILGRTQQTGIVDPRLSKNQMKFEADYSMSRVFVEQLGYNKSAVNEESMIKGEKRFLYHGDTVSLLFHSEHTYRLDFVSPLSYGVESRKRPITLSDQHIVSKKPCMGLTENWETRDGTLLVYNSSNLVHKNKIAAFDMDGTIIVTKSGNVFPIDNEDWKIYCLKIIKSIKTLSNNGYKIVIFTNQGGIGSKKVNENLFKEKIENIISMIKTPVQVFVATSDDIYRKPAPGMWNVLVSNYNGGLTIDMHASFFCGDAAGRPTRNFRKIKKDHSCCDRLFAMNIGVKFYTPEEYFFKRNVEQFKLPTFNSNDVMANITFTDPPSKLFSSNKKEMIIMVGCPGSGKSYFASNKLGHRDRTKIISRDALGSYQKCLNEAQVYLKRSEICVVIDNTNPTVESRKRFIDLAKSMNVPVRVLLMNTSKEHAKHNNKFRQLTDKSHQKVSDIIINIYFSKFEEPSESEGIDEIVKINFVPDFKDSKHETLYKMYLL